MNRLKIGSWKSVSILTAVLALVGACAGGGDRKGEAYAQEAWAYFKKMCDANSGEKVYRTYNGVKSVFVSKPLSPATQKDLWNQYWYGDPYSNATPWDRRAEAAASTLASPNAPVAPGKSGRGFDFVETAIPATEKEAARIEKYFYLPGARDHMKEPINRTVSRFGISWEDISTPEDRKYWVAGSRLRVVDLADNSVVAERIGYLIEPGFGSLAGHRNPWLTARGPRTTCPAISNGDFEDRWFVLKVLSPVEENRNGK